MEIFKKFIDNQNYIDDESSKKFIKATTLKHFQKKEFLSKVGETATSFYILKSGVVRSYYIDETGKTHIRNLFTKMETTGDVGALLTGEPTKLYYDCLTDCEIYVVNFESFIDLTKQNHGFSMFYNTILTKVTLTFEAKIYDLSLLNGTARYLKLKKQIPEIENLIPQYHIASYLNISPVQLSRIRKEIYSK
ncbi:Crp/Fnr family transcriptional regulator [Polaribacter sp. IC073]|uniref:Crp/Fnr family transcriptional regulator n=1 Tax=Polaribacter sp. IC073 TaxID=2508540 RepID=UPI0011BDC2C8|nr:Crp/Fnr family transcriptional regulator [Polaribacter sp. IC073]TXD48728.1 Crp/Fnr family transcriptional regulator [Polaribacter sp. IC073]